MYKRLYEEERSLHLSHTHSSEALAGRRSFLCCLTSYMFPFSFMVQSILNGNRGLMVLFNVKTIEDLPINFTLNRNCLHIKFLV